MDNAALEQYFIELTKKHWPDEAAADPLFFAWFKAQGIAESGLKPLAKSTVGACGIMQIMQGTYRDIRLWLPHLSKDIFDVQSNIEAGIWYMRWCFDRLSVIEDFNDRLLIALACYNGSTRKMNITINEKGLKTYAEIKPLLPLTTQRYIERIKRFREAIIERKAS